MLRGNLFKLGFCEFSEFCVKHHHRMRSTCQATLEFSVAQSSRKTLAQFCRLGLLLRSSCLRLDAANHSFVVPACELSVRVLSAKQLPKTRTFVACRNRPFPIRPRCRLTSSARSSRCCGRRNRVDLRRHCIVG